MMETEFPTSSNIAGALNNAQVPVSSSPSGASNAEKTAVSDQIGTDSYESSGETVASSNPETEQLSKMAEQLEEQEKHSATNIIKILNENSPNFLKSIRAIIAERSGMNELRPSVDLAQLEKTLQAAAGSPDPSQRVADVMQGLSVQSEEFKRKFLEVAEKILGAERAVAEAVPPTVAGNATPKISLDEVTGTYAPESVGLSVEVNFDLFFSVSSQYAVQAGEDASGAYLDASAAVAARFAAGFSLSVNGRFFDLADMAASLDTKVLDAFSQAVSGLADMDDESLERFYDATEDLFASVEDALGLDDGALAGMAEAVTATAAGFFQAVDAAVNEVFPGVDAGEIMNLGKSLNDDGETDLLSLLNQVLEKSDASTTPRTLLQSLLAAENARSALQDAENATGLGALLEKLTDQTIDHSGLAA